MSHWEYDLQHASDSPINEQELEPSAEDLYLEALDELTPSQADRISTYVGELWKEIRNLKK